MNAGPVITAGNVRDLEEGVPSVVAAEVGGIAVAVWRGKLYAFRATCPHEQGPVGCGRVRTPLVSDRTGTAGTDESRPVVICPWHRWEYDLGTGRGVRNPRAALRTFKVWQEDDTIYVDTSKRPGREG
ncbi:hypothetical protein GCM10009836_25360 [Pseudonocardia ailaonensis]|uniref:Rieske domain-containing protein n=1 Tax=Pseudonocardia ailaonensis TaxID=367279 RepID=A0ABN2MZ77_9PSEU